MPVPWLIYVINYGTLSKRKKLNINNHRIAAGDFNSVTKREEVSNPGSFDNHRSAKFNEWIFDEALVDLGFNGQCFTWKRGNENSNFRGARLDRALCSIDRLERSTKTKVHHLAAINSDHCPILISIGDWSEVRPSDFRYQGAWATHLNFLNIVGDNWNKEDIVWNNSKNMATTLKAWNNITFGNIHQRKKILTKDWRGSKRYWIMNIIRG